MIDTSFEINELNDIFDGYYPYELIDCGNYEFIYKSSGNVKSFWPCGYTQDISMSMINRLIEIGAQDIKITSCEKNNDGLLCIQINFYYCI